MRRVVTPLAVLAVLATLAGCMVDGPVTPGLRDGRTLWSADFESGDLKAFQDPPSDVAGPTPAVLVSDPVRQGRDALAVTIAGPKAPQGIVLQPKVPQFEPGDDLWFGFSTYLKPGFPTSALWQSVLQFKQNFDGSPPLGLDVAKGSWLLEGGVDRPGGGKPFNLAIGPATTGVWTDWVIHVVFSPDPAVGRVQLWMNGVPKFIDFAPATGTMYPNPKQGDDRSYLKLGYIRNAGITAPGTVVIDEVRIGTAMGAVRYIPESG